MLLCRRQNSTVTVHLFARHFSSGKFSNRKNPEKARRRAVLTEIARKSGDLNKYAIDTKGLDRPITTRSVGQIVNEYTPPERGYRASLLSKKGWLQRWEAFKMKLVTTYSIGIIKRYAKPFKVIAFAKEAEKLFSEVNTALASSDKKSLLDLTTENAYQGLRKEYHNQKVSWTLVSTVRRPKVVHARVIPVLTKENYFAQVTVRLHTTQMLVVYDKSNQLVKGDGQSPKEVIDYVVVERHIVQKGSSWRICGKIIPHWKFSMPQK